MPLEGVCRLFWNYIKAGFKAREGAFKRVFRNSVKRDRRHAVTGAARRGNYF